MRLMCVCLFLFFCAVKGDEVVEEIINEEAVAVDQDAQENSYSSAMKKEDDNKRYDDYKKDDYVDDFVKRLAAYKYEDVNYENYKKMENGDKERDEGEDKKRDEYEDIKRDEDDKYREMYKGLPDYKDGKDDDENDKKSPDYKDENKRDEGAEKKKYDDYYDKEDNNYYGNDKMGYQRRYDEPFNQKTIKKLDEIFDYTGPTANDEPENIIRPCSLDDWQCIRKYFAANGKCTPAHGPIPDPFLIEKNTVYFSAVNLTATFLKYVVRGLSSTKINDFYVNKKSGNLVLALDVQDLNLTSPRAYLRYRRTAKESIVLADTATVNFRSLTFTAVISKVPKLRLDHADIHVDIDDPYPIFAFGPKAIKSTDPDVISAYAQLVALLPISVRESLIFLAPLITGMYIQETICDFGIKFISL